jgi:hypothetical protein
MSATYGLRSSVSSASAALQQCLASRLQERLVSRGSIMFTLTWKEQVTPLRRRICRLAASALRIDDSGCGGLQQAEWLTPTNQSGGPTNSAEDVIRHQERGYQITLHGQVMLAAWPTPMAGTPKQNGYNEAGNTDSSRRTVELAGWATPQVFDATNCPSGNLEAKKAKGGCANLREQVRGATSNGSPAQTAKPGLLNPAFSRWLMGYPAEWDDCAPTETRSSRKSRRNS